MQDFQDRVPIRGYEYFWDTDWKAAYPKLDDLTWPGHCPYYALSSGTTSGSTKYLPVTREMVKSNSKAAFTTLAFFRHSHPQAKLLVQRPENINGPENTERHERIADTPPKPRRHGDSVVSA